MIPQDLMQSFQIKMSAETFHNFKIIPREYLTNLISWLISPTRDNTITNIYYEFLIYVYTLGLFIPIVLFSHSIGMLRSKSFQRDETGMLWMHNPWPVPLFDQCLRG